MKFLIAICHPDHLWQTLFWQNYHFQVFWNLKRHPTSLSNCTEHFAVTPALRACARTEGWGGVRQVGGRPFRPLVNPCHPPEGSSLPSPWVMPWQAYAADFRKDWDVISFLHLSKEEREWMAETCPPEGFAWYPGTWEYPWQPVRV